MLKLFGHDLGPVDGVVVAEFGILHDPNSAPEDFGETGEADVLHVVVLVEGQSPVLRDDRRVIGNIINKDSNKT